MSLDFDASGIADLLLPAIASNYGLATTHSMFCWMKATVADFPEGFAGLMDKRQDEATFGILKTTRIVRVWIESTPVDSTLAIMDSAWNHVGYTYDDPNTSNEIEIWVNGVSDGTQSNSQSLSEGNTSLAIGSRFTQSRDYDGLIEDAAVWNRKLSDSEIESLFFGKMVAGSLPNGLTAWWELAVPGDAVYNDAVTSDLGVLDRSGHGHDITTITGTPTWSEDSPGLHRPSRPHVVIAAPPAGGGGPVIPVIQHGYRLRRAG